MVHDLGAAGRVGLHHPTMPATAKDVAREAGVHPSTVSRSLDPKQSSRVSSVTRKRVVEVANRLGYHPDFTASSLRRQRSMTIGVITPSFSNPIYGELIHGIGTQLERAGYLALTLEDPDGAGRMGVALATLRARRVDGIVCASARAADALALRKAAAGGIPLVLALRWTPEAGLPQVLNGDAQGATLAAEHLLGLGHRTLIQLPGPQDITTFTERARGFRETVLSASAVHLDHDLIAATPTVDEGRRVMGELLAGGGIHGATAIFAHNDLLAIGAIDVLRESGLGCPGDISVIGYNDNALTDHLNPPLSTIRMPIDEMGRLAARRIIQAVTGEGELPETITLPPELVVRDSTAPPR